MPSSRRSSRPRERTRGISCIFGIVGGFFTTESPNKPLNRYDICLKQFCESYKSASSWKKKGSWHLANCIDTSWWGLCKEMSLSDERVALHFLGANHVYCRLWVCLLIDDALVEASATHSIAAASWIRLRYLVWKWPSLRALAVVPWLAVPPEMSRLRCLEFFLVRHFQMHDLIREDRKIWEKNRLISLLTFIEVLILKCNDFCPNPPRPQISYRNRVVNSLIQSFPNQGYFLLYFPARCTYETYFLRNSESKDTFLEG